MAEDLIGKYIRAREYLADRKADQYALTGNDTKWREWSRRWVKARNDYIMYLIDWDDYRATRR